LQWLQNPNQTIGDNLNNIRCEIGSPMRNKKREYLKEKMNELKTNRTQMSDSYRTINEF